MTDTFDFDRALRAESALNITVRTLRLMAALSEKNGFASMGVERMAKELKATKEAIRRARQKAVALGYFDKPKGWKYHRRKLDENETKADFWGRMRKDRRLDLAARIAFLLCDETKKNGAVTISLAEIVKHLNTKRSSLHRALETVMELDHFSRDLHERAGINTFSRKWGIYHDAAKPEAAETADAADAADPDGEEIFAHWTQRTGRQRQRAGADRK